MDKALLVTKKRKFPWGYGFPRKWRSGVDVADSSHIAFAMYLLGHTDGHPYRAVYVDRSVRAGAFFSLKDQISRYERKRNLPPVVLLRPSLLSGWMAGLTSAVLS